MNQEELLDQIDARTEEAHARLTERAERTGHNIRERRAGNWCGLGEKPGHAVTKKLKSLNDKERRKKKKAEGEGAG